MLCAPFKGLRPVRGRESEVIAPPYDVVNSAEAAQLAADRPYSFLHISHPEIDAREGADLYATASEALANLSEQGVLARDSTACYYVYRISTEDHVQTGVALAASVDAYIDNRIRKHEFTRPDKEDERAEHIDRLNAQTGPVLLVYAEQPQLDTMLQTLAAVPPDMDALLVGVRHQVWVVREAEQVRELDLALNDLPAMYIADGHHRSAAAARVCERRQRGDASEYFLAVAFPHTQMNILDYNRVVTDLNGLSSDGFLERVGQRFGVMPEAEPVRPHRPREFGLYLDAQWYRLVANDTDISDDPVKGLDASILSDGLLAPILGIHDPRRDARIDFVGGARGLDGLQRRVDEGDMVAAFSLFPTPMEALMAVADSGEVMPPKSTWFEPKLADGLLSYILE